MYVACRMLFHISEIRKITKKWFCVEEFQQSMNIYETRTIVESNVM